MKRTTLFASVLLLAAVAAGQWLEHRVWLPDSFSGLQPRQLVINRLTNILYATGAGNSVVGLDARYLKKVAKTAINPYSPTAIVADEGNNRVYCTDADRNEVLFIDCAAGRVDTTVRVGRVPWALCFNPRTGKLYCANRGDWMDWDSTVTVVDVVARSVVATIGVGAGPQSLYCDTLGNRVYCACWDDQVAVIDGARDSVRAVIPVSGVPREFCHNTQRGKVYCAAVNNGTLAVIDASGDSLLGVIAGLAVPIALCYNPVNDRVLCAGQTLSGYGDTVWVVDCATDSIIARPRVGHWPTALLHDPSSNKIVCGLNEDDAVLISGDSNQVIGSVPGSASLEAMCLGPDSGRVYGVCYSGQKVIAIEPAGDTIVEEAGLRAVNPTHVCLNPVNGRLYASGDDALYVINAQTYDVLCRIACSSRVGVAVCCPANNKVYALTADSAVAVVDCGGDSLLAVLRFGSPLGVISYNSVHGKVYCTDQLGGRVFVIDCAGDTLLRTVSVDDLPMSLWYEPAHDRVFCGTRWRDGFDVIDGASDTVVSRVSSGPSRARCFCRRATEDKLYVAGSDSRLMVYDAAGLQPLATVSVAEGASDMLYNPTSDKVYHASGGSRRLTIVDAQRDSVVWSFSPGGFPAVLTCDSILDKVYCSHDSAITVVDGQTNRMVRRVYAGWYPSCFQRSADLERTFVGHEGSPFVAVLRDTMVGLVQGPDLTAGTRPERPSLVRGALRLPADRGPAVLLDITGRKVADLLPGPNDIRHLAPGVYFLAPSSAVTRGPTAVQKVIVQR